MVYILNFTWISSSDIGHHVKNIQQSWPDFDVSKQKLISIFSAVNVSYGQTQGKIAWKYVLFGKLHFKSDYTYFCKLLWLVQYIPNIQLQKKCSENKNFVQ